MRKYVLNWGVMSAVLGVISVVQLTRRSPRDWRILLAWAAWALSLVVAVTSVHDRSRELATTDD